MDMNNEHITKRDSWMTMDIIEHIPTITKTRKEFKRPNPEEKLGTHQRELNPYWKNGGVGLPSEDCPTASKSEKHKSGMQIGDGGLLWWEKALQRCKQMSAEEGKSLEEIAEERYGSLEFLYQKIDECRRSSKPKNLLDFKSKSRPRFHQPSRDNFSNTSKFKEDKDNRLKDNQLKDNQLKDNQLKDSSSKSSDMSKKRWSKQNITTIDELVSNNKMNCRDNKETIEMASSCSESDEEVRSQPTSAKSSSIPTITEEKESFLDQIQMTENEMNQLGAQIVKAELFGDVAKAAELKKKLEAARSAKSRPSIAASSNSKEQKVELLITKDRFGNMRPLEGDFKSDVKDRRSDKKRKAKETHSNGERQKYFDDDNNYSLQDLVQREKRGQPEDSFKKYARLANKISAHDEDFDDRLIDGIAGAKSNLMDSRQKQLAIIEQKRMSSKLDKCHYCFDNIEKHLIIAIGKLSILCMPRYQSMVDDHCLIVPMQHITQMTQCDEDVAADIEMFIKCLAEMYSSRDNSCILMETCINLKKHQHCVIECIPVPSSLAPSCPMYFKKAISEMGSEWAQNKKLVQVKQRAIRNAVPVGFPYFWVSFGSAGGYVHVIEDEKSFPEYFGREIIGGMLDLDPFLWRKPRIDTFEKQRNKTVAFSKLFKKFDCTKPL